jgi:hypothetical protein
MIDAAMTLAGMIGLGLLGQLIDSIAYALFRRRPRETEFPPRKTIAVYAGDGIPWE